METRLISEQGSELFQQLVSSAEKYIQQLGVASLEQISEDSSAPEGKISLEDVTAFIQIGGSQEGGFLFTLTEQQSRAFSKLFMLDPITEEEAAQYAVEVVAEMANVITGNALTEREHNDILLGNPLMILTRKAVIRAKGKRTYTQAYRSQDGSFRLIYIPMEHKAELASILALHLD